MGYSKPFKPSRSNLPNFYFPAKPAKPAPQVKQARESNKITESESPSTLQLVTAKQMETIAQIIDAHVKRERRSTKRKRKSN